MSRDQFNPARNFKHDIPASIVVFLVALPLCLGVALASGAPLFSGIIAGIVGGIVVGFASGSALSVSGPAAGLTTIVLAGITTLGNYNAFLVTVFLAGIIQIVLGYINAGSIGNYFPSTVIKGMLAAIGIILVLKQIPHAIGYDKDFVGDESFSQSDGENTFSELFHALDYFNPGAIFICVLSLVILTLWERPYLKNKLITTVLPAPLLVVALGVSLNEIFKIHASQFVIDSEHLVSLPIASSLSSLADQFAFPDFSVILTKECWTIAFTIGIVASLESLLSIEAVDKLDPLKRITPLNRELKAQGLANMVSGLIGGLPVTAVIVRSSANIAAGAKTKTSAIAHGVLLLLTVFLIPGLLNKIPLACLAAILLKVGYKLAKPSIIMDIYRQGMLQFIPFAVTILAILLTDLLIGIIIGISVGVFFVLRTNFHRALFSVNEDGNHLIRLTKDVSFLNKALLRETFGKIPDGSNVIIDGPRSAFIDHDILEAISDFKKSSVARDIHVEFNESLTAYNAILKT